MSLAIIQARMSSQRLPGKVMMDICGKTVLQRVVERVKKARFVSKIVVATSTNESNNAIEEECKKIDVECYRCPFEENVLNRFYTCCLGYLKQESIVRITADCPLIDPFEIDKAIIHYRSGDYDYVTTSGILPDGMDIEVFSFKALTKSWQETYKKSDIEHVTLYMLNNPQKFKVKKIGEDVFRVPKLSVDTEEDLNRIRSIYEKYGDDVTLEQIVRYFELHKML